MFACAAIIKPGPIAESLAKMPFARRCGVRRFARRVLARHIREPSLAQPRCPSPKIAPPAFPRAMMTGDMSIDAYSMADRSLIRRAGCRMLGYRRLLLNAYRQDAMMRKRLISLEQPCHNWPAISH